MSHLSAPILVTGAAGFVGSHLLDLLAQQSQPLVGCFHPAASPRDPRPDVTWVALDLLNREAVADMLGEQRPEAIYHLAGAAHVAQSWQNLSNTYEGNVLATHHLFEALRIHELRPRVFVSGSAMIYRPQDRPIREDDALGPTSPYATSKLAQEMLAQRAWETDGVPTLIARSFNHVGPRQDPSYVAPGIAKQIALIEAGRQDPVITMGNLEPKRDLSDVRDTVRAYVAMMDGARPGEPYNVCSGKGLSIAELVETFVARARTPVRVVQDPARFRPNDVPLAGRRSPAADRRDRLATRHTVRAHRRRSAGVLATASPHPLMRVLVTGGTGYLGRAVVRAFAAAGHEVVALSRTASRSGVSTLAVDGDVRNREAVERAADGCQVICHLAALVALWRARSSDFDEVNLGGLRNVLAVSAERGLPIVYTSSFLALPPRGRADPLMANDYQRTKVLAEREAAVAARGGARIVRLYPGVLYGPGVSSEGNLVGRLIDDHLRGRLPGVIGADGIWSCSWVDDVARAHVAAAEHGAPGATYALGGENLPQMQIFTAVEAITGTPRPRRIPTSRGTT